MLKFKNYLYITLFVITTATYAASATYGDSNATAPCAGAGFASLVEPSSFEDCATEMLSQEPYKSRHKSDCFIFPIGNSSSRSGSGTLMQTDAGHLFILTAAHVIEGIVGKIIVAFPNNFKAFIKDRIIPSPISSINPQVENGFVCEGDLKRFAKIQIIDGKVVNYEPPRFAWEEEVKVLRVDGTEETLPGIHTLSGDAYRNRVSLMRDYAVLILDKYPPDIMPAKIASHESIPVPKPIFGDRKLQETVGSGATAGATLSEDFPPRRIPCSLSGFGDLFVNTSAYGFMKRKQEAAGIRQSFRVLDVESCASQPVMKYWDLAYGVKYGSIGALIEPKGCLMDDPDSGKYQIIASALLESKGPRSPDDMPLVVVPLEIKNVGLSAPTFSGFSGSTLRDFTTGEVIGMAHASRDFPFMSCIVRQNIYHTLVPERDRIYGMVHEYYKKKEVEARTEAFHMQCSQAYSVMAVNYSLWTF